jgi:hypothetical protein
LKLSSEGYSPGLLKKIEYAGGNGRSFQTAAQSLERLAEFSISAKHVERLTERLGKERAGLRDKAVAAMKSRTLRSAYKQPPAVAVISVDAGKAQFRQENKGPGVHEAHWGDTKVACLQTYSNVGYDKDPKPDPPEAFLDPHRVERMLRDAWGGRVQQVIDTLKSQSERMRADASNARDACHVVELAMQYVERNRQRMDYPRYRRLGLPVSSALVESLIKQINQRVKGTEQFWNTGGLEAVLQVRAAYLSEDDRSERLYEQRPRGPAVGRNRAKAFQQAR